MAALQHWFRRPIGALLLAALLLVPIALSGHAHAGPVHPCSVCVVTHHAPIVSTQAIPALATYFVCLLSALPPTPAHTRLDRAPQTGRGPPLRSITVDS